MQVESWSSHNHQSPQSLLRVGLGILVYRRSGLREREESWERTAYLKRMGHCCECLKWVGPSMLLWQCYRRATTRRYHIPMCRFSNRTPSSKHSIVGSSPHISRSSGGPASLTLSGMLRVKFTSRPSISEAVEGGTNAVRTATRIVGA
jgi:hypothetical protein